MLDNNSPLSLSAQNSRPAFVANDAEHTCSKIYASAVSQVFHVKESSSTGKSMYTTVSMAAFAPGNEIKSPSINAYPNPSRGITKLSLKLPGNDNYKIRVSNTIGRVVYTQEVSNYESTAVDLDMRSLPSGIYFYSLLVNDKTVETKRLVLQK
ncbi:T9SS type A sorting domain-containing protein [Pontibacter silvestris]|uniref:T9SS type A sorting domain-containing protein n=1 Tax=Pontibacter silvestris TaxID=2305183 RepID=A0ABW4WVM4_9BACT|nr:T9SS type A sorting domain-containing protein [Pontibacter silvestris]MCC9137306.1 T9SS type A sorting domain-containing protein [Pontibacter silvestris]